MIASSASGSFAKKCFSIFAYGENSTFFGSTITSFTCAGCFLYKMEAIITFNPTDFPCPVAPATRRCGIFSKSTTKGSPDTVLPSASGRTPPSSWNFRERSIDSIETIARCLLGTSIPIAPGRMKIRTPNTRRRSAKSFSKLSILVTFTPAPGIIS